MSITENTLRIGSFTSSNIHKLMTLAKDGSFGKPALTYISEKNIERKMGRSLECETTSNVMAWGIFLEQRVLDLIGLEYKHSSTETDQHPDYDFWTGSKDMIVEGLKISEVKCYQPKNFALYTDALMTKDISIIRSECPEEYYQAISNAIINNVPKTELISYMPYRSELEAIREMANNYDGSDQWKYRFIAEKEDSWLAWLPDNGYYKNLNVFEFVVPEEDKILLTSKVIAAGKLLIPRLETVTA